jgi:hypothetical protein
MKRFARVVPVVGGPLVAILVVSIAGVAPATVAGDEPTVELRWALGAAEAAGETPSALTRDTQLKTGARLKFLVEPRSPVSVYLILEDSKAELHVLYRHDSSSQAGKPAYFPPGPHWFELDDEPGTETFFLLASVKPLAKLETLLARYESAEAASRMGLRDEIVAEIRRLYLAHRDFARPAEKPVMIGGRTRGDESETSAIDRLAVEISAERFYGKTITIEH